MNYDDWKTAYPSPGGGGYSKPATLYCTGCSFRGDFSAAVEHVRGTGHAVTCRGVIQDLSKFAVPTPVSR